MSKAIAQRQATAAATGDWDEEQVRLIKDVLTTKLTDNEFSLFAQVCLRTGLDPFTRQIYAIKRRQLVDGQWVEKMTIQTGIDGYRVIAEQTGEYAGGDEPAEGPPCGCGDTKFGAHPEYMAITVNRIKQGLMCATSDRARFHEYVQTVSGGAPNSMWKKMPHSQLAKCAEARALRRAFPGRFEGVYTTEEMGQADNDEDQQHSPRQVQARVVDSPAAAGEAPEEDNDFGPCDEPGCAGRLIRRSITKANRQVSVVLSCSEDKYLGGKCDRLTDWNPNWAQYNARKARHDPPEEGEKRPSAHALCPYCEAEGLTSMNGRPSRFTPHQGKLICIGVDGGGSPVMHDIHGTTPLIAAPDAILEALPTPADTAVPEAVSVGVPTGPEGDVDPDDIPF